mgnify:CR=1 FL=1
MSPQHNRCMAVHVSVACRMHDRQCSFSAVASRGGGDGIQSPDWACQGHVLLVD